MEKKRNEQKKLKFVAGNVCQGVNKRRRWKERNNKQQSKKKYENDNNRNIKTK